MRRHRRSLSPLDFWTAVLFAIVTAFVILWTVHAHAQVPVNQPIALTCNAPTQNTDPKAPMSLPLKFTFFHGTTPGGPYPDKSPAQSSCAYTWPGFTTGGGHYFVVNATDHDGDTSGFSNEAAIGVAWSMPLPPTTLVVSGPQPVYSIVQSHNNIAFVQVGTASGGAVCDTTHRFVQVNPDGSQLPYFIVPRESVMWIGSVKPQTVWAFCSPPP